MQSAKKLFVWDFHGVLEKGTEFASGEISNIILEKYRYKKRLTQEEVLKLYGQKWYKYFEYLLPEESHEKHIVLQEACYEYGTKNFAVITKFIEPNDFVHEVLETVGKKHQQILISNTRLDSLNSFVKSIGVEKYFTPHIYSAVDRTKELRISKKDVLKNFLKDNPFEQIIIIGDSPADMEMVDVAGGITYLYSHPSLSHKDTKSDYKITSLKDLLKEL